MIERNEKLTTNYQELLASSEQLLQSREELNSLMRISRDIHILTDRDGGILQVSSSSEAIDKIDRLVGGRLVDFVLQSHRGKLLQMLEVARMNMADGAIEPACELHFVSQRSKAGMMIASGQVIRVGDTKDLTFYWLIQDITHLREREFESRISSEVLNNVSEGVMITDVDGEIRAVNPAFTNITGYSAEEAIGRNPRFLQSGMQSIDFYHNFWKSLEDTGTWVGMIHNKTKTGRDYPQWLCVTSVKDETGSVLSYIGVFSDLSEMHKTEQLRAICSLSPDAVVSFCKDGYVKYVNPTFEIITGLDAHSVIGLGESEFTQLISGLCTPQSRFCGIAALRAMQNVEENKPKNPCQKFEILTSRKVVEVGIRESDSETISVLLYFRDITHENEVDRMKSEFLSTAAHELRTPMASIYGFSELLLNQSFSAEEQQELVETIYKQSVLMISIINELLDLARIESKRGQDFEITSINIIDLIRDVMRGYVPPDGRTPPKLLQGNQPVLARADRSKLIQVLNNIVSNAYKYSPMGGEVTIELVQSQSTQASEMVGVKIVDAGIGMTSEQLSHVFDRFYRADTSGKISGTGLGMCIVKEIVELHGGSIGIESEIGKGTAVTIWIPIDTAVANDSLLVSGTASLLAEQI